MLLNESASVFCHFRDCYPVIGMGQKCATGRFAFWIWSILLPLWTNPESCKEPVTMDDPSLYGISEVLDLWHLPCVCGRRLHRLSPALILFNF